MMEILCSETNRMDKNCPAALNLGLLGPASAANGWQYVQGRYGGNRLRLSLRRALLGLSRNCGSVISFKQLFRAFNQPKKAKRS
jgi:hypothetical protein